MIKRFLQLFTVGSKQMRDSYFKFQTQNEKVLISFFNLMVFLVAVSILIVALINNLPYERIILRSTIILISLFAYLVKNKYLIVQKVFLLLIMAVALVTYMMEAKIFSNLTYDDSERFLIGNGLGLAEMVLLLCFKNICTRSFIYGGFIIIKLVAVLWRQVDVNQYRTMLIMAVFILVLLFLLIDNILEKRIFKTVYEAKDKLQKFQTLLSNDLPLSVVIINSNLDEILYSNDYFRTNFQKQDESLIHQELDVKVFSKFIIRVINRDLIEDNEEISLIAFLKRIDNVNSSFQIQEGEVATLSAHFNNEEDSELHYEIKLRKIIWEGNNSYAMVLHDVSDKQRIITLKLADEQKDRVIATVSHELRTPINGILGLLEMVAARTQDTVSLNYINYAKSCSKLLLYLVNSILDLSQLRHNCIQISKNSFNIQTFLEELKSLYIFHSQQKGIEFKVIIEPTVPRYIYTDKHRLIQILINLLGNAMKFTFHGSITLNVSRDIDDPQKLIFRAEDTGIGIREEDKHKLFQMFGKITQNDKTINTQGVGLGLTIANELVKLLNDSNINEERILFESEYGKGTTFWFRIDAFSKSPARSFCSLLSQDFDFYDTKELSRESTNRLNNKLMQYASPFCLKSKLKLMRVPHIEKYEENSDDKGPKNKFEKPRHVLLVDDSPFNLIAAAFIFELLGFLTQKAFNGKEGLDYLKQTQESEKQYCMVLTDIQMPILDGIEMSKCISQSIKKGEIYEVPIVAITAKKLSEQEKTEYREYGIAHAMEKPLILEEVKRVLENLGLIQNESKE